MSLDKEEKERLAQLGLDRRLAEAVGALETECGIFLRVAGEENAEEEAVMQAASNYRAAVQRRNIAYDRACGVAEDEAGKATASTAAPEVDYDAVAKLVEKALATAKPEAPADPPKPEGKGASTAKGGGS